MAYPTIPIERTRDLSRRRRPRRASRSFLRLPLACALLALVFGAAAPAAGPPLPLIERGVRVLGVNVGDMTSEQARARVHAAFQRPVTFTVGDETWRAPPSELGADADVDHAVAAALRAAPRTTVPMRVSIWKARLETYVSRLNSKYSYAAKNAELTGLEGMTPVITA